MGCSCSARVKDDDSSENKSAKTRSTLNKRSFSSTMRFQVSIYHAYIYKTTSNTTNNLLIHTDILNYQNDFHVIDENSKNTTTNSVYKNISGIAVGYMKGYKLDVQNQDKFFILLDGEVEIYCVIDGHGPFGNIIGQIIQDKFFRDLTEAVFDETFDIEYERILKNLFEMTQNLITRKEGKYKDDYDPFLSGAAVTLVIRKENHIYCANVGNILAFIMYSERVYSYGFKTKVLNTDDANFKVDSSTHQANSTSVNPHMMASKMYYNHVESNH
jgi:hypothetical protein